MCPLVHGFCLTFIELETPPKEATTLSKKIQWALASTFNPRFIERCSQTRELPQFPIRRYAHLSSKKDFVITRLLIAWSFLALWNLLQISHRHYQKSLQMGDYAPDKERLIRRISEVAAREIFIRLSLPLWQFIPDMLAISAHHYFIAAVAVFFHGSDAIGRWKFPVFGRIKEAYTIRNFWRYTSPQLFLFIG